MSAFTALSGIIVLTRTRAMAPEKGSRSLLLDASVYASDDHDECPSLSLVHYFNDENIDFNDDNPKPVNAVIHFTITPTSLNPQLLPPTFNNHDYAFIGDIAHLCVLPETCVTESRPYVIATGTVSSTSAPDSHSFTLTSDEYVSIIHGTATCTLSCTFLSTPRWANTPIPRHNTVMTIGGTLQETIRATDGSVTSFGITIEAISFTPRQLPVHQNPPTLPSSLSSSPSKTRFAYKKKPLKRKADNENAKTESTKRKPTTTIPLRTRKQNLLAKILLIHKKISFSLTTTIYVVLH